MGLMSGSVSRRNHDRDLITDDEHQPPKRNPAGATGLVTAIIERAFYDAVRGPAGIRGEARLYFFSDWYWTHLELLDLPPGILPRRWEEM
jgi:hypothetical protein